MFSTDPVSSHDRGTSARTTGTNGQLGQNEFLTLMITQLQNQDPLKPLDPSEFLGQLAQFSTVIGVQNVQSAMTDLSEALRSSQALSGATLVGREVLAPGSTASLAQGGSVKGAVDVPHGATAIQVIVRDASGQVVRTLSIAPQPGLTEFTWDGLDATGTPVPAGEYGIEALASVAGETVALDPLLAAEVESVTIDPTGNRLILNTRLGALSLGDVRRIS